MHARLAHLLLQPRNPFQVYGQAGSGMAQVRALEGQLQRQDALRLVEGHDDLLKLLCGNSYLNLNHGFFQLGLVRYTGTMIFSSSWGGDAQECIRKG